MTVDDLRLEIVKEIHVNASIEHTFEALLEQIGPGNVKEEDIPMPMKLEAWPGGRWYRDLGDGNGHFWANVQAIKRPTLIEFCGPLFASYPAMSNVQYRVKEQDGGTLITFRHSALGSFQEDHKQGMVMGWTAILDKLKKRAEGAKSHAA